MANLGTTERPAILRVRDAVRADAAMRICEDRGWQVIVGVEPDKPEELTDLAYLLAAEVHAPKVGRNEPCPCGSGKKFKKCCEGLPSPAERLVDAVASRLGTAPGVLALVGPYHEPSSPLAAAFEALWAWLARQPWRAGELARAHDDFLGEVVVPREPEARQALADVFADWFLLDRPLSAAAGAAAGLTPAAAAHPGSPLAGSRFAAHVVTAVDAAAVTVRGLDPTAEACRVAGTGGMTLAPGHLLVGRLFPWEGGWIVGSYFSGLAPVGDEGFEPDELEDFATIADARGYAEVLGVGEGP